MSKNDLGLAAIGDNAIELITTDRLPHYEAYGWHHWPEHPWLSYQFRRGLGETQEGGGSVSEVMQAASRMIPGSLELTFSRSIRRVFSPPTTIH